MKVPLSWLKEYVDHDKTPKELAALLTFSGTEVEGITTIGGDYTGVVVGEVLSVTRHPNADRLTVCEVNSGRETLTVVCGAPNVAVGQKVPLATIGVTLPNGMTIKKAKVRGVESFGMLCAEDELKLSDAHDGVMVLPPETAAGTPFETIVGPPETVLDLEVTANRPDCLSMIGVAREIAALLCKPLRIPEPVFKEEGRPAGDLVQVAIEDAEGCGRYTARVLSNLTIQPSPRWMRQRLAAAGVRPINNVVDVTNYVMLECGQPLHAFDYDLVGEGRIVVRRAKPGETMSTLDGAPRELSPDMLMIADAKRSVAVAGVMGGAGSEIRAETATVLLESAYFNPKGVRRTSKRLGLSTESSYRFERGVDRENVEWASRRAAQLMCELGGGVAARGVVDVHPGSGPRRKVELRFDRARDLLGMQLPVERMVAILEALGLTVLRQDAVRCEVECPAFRVDIEQEADLIEEIARIEGLDRVPSPSPSAIIVPGADDLPIRAVMACRETLVGLGLAEIMNYSFLSEKLLNTVGYGLPAARLKLPNPISADHTVLRDSLIPQMIETLGRNRARQCREAALFELGRVFFKQSDGACGEEDRLCVGLLGPAGRSGLLKTAPVKDEEMYQWIRGILDGINRALHVGPDAGRETIRGNVELRPVESSCFEEGRSVTVVLSGQACGVMGLMSERVRSEWRLADPVAVLELAMGPLLRQALRVPVSAAVGVYPGIERDVAMVVDESVSHEQVLNVVLKAAPRELVDVRLFDVYRGESLGAGRKSQAYSMTYRSMERTLTDEETNRFHDQVKAALRTELRAEIREG